MPFDRVMPKFAAGRLHSGSKHGPIVKSKAQAIAIMLSEKRAAKGGKKEYQPKHEAAKRGLKAAGKRHKK